MECRHTYYYRTKYVCFDKFCDSLEKTRFEIFQGSYKLVNIIVKILTPMNISGGCWLRTLDDDAIDQGADCWGRQIYSHSYRA